LKNLIKISAFIGILSCMGFAQAVEESAPAADSSAPAADSSAPAADGSAPATKFELFSDAWMKAFMEEWNKETEALVDKLAKLDNPFTANIAYGFYGEDKPKGVLIVEKGKATGAGSYNDETLKWDLRAKPGSWEKWLKAGKIGKLDMAKPARWGGLGFEKGNYSAMMKDPSMMGPFLKSFEVMSRVPTKW